ncbi:DL-endopeptidase inhibitor IseA family protein [Brevibacillus sp. H7]|uniref:DL-endopeptidase inhibitor IseA family protein n=1 Tax=Brevibacillus sp. H7 TaxID=3349138 RepID=UPI00380B6F7F
MTKGKKYVILTAMVSMLAAGCSETSMPESNPSQQEPLVTQPAQPAPTEPAPATNQPVTAPEEKMDEKAVVKLVAEGMSSYWHVMTGGEGAGGTTDGGPIPTFQVNGMEYRYLGKDIETKEKLMAYLQQSLTQEASEAFIKAANIIEHEGRLGQPNADGGSMLQWENAQASLIDETADRKKYELKVPYGEEPNLEFQPVTVEVKKAESSGWRINTPPHQLR